MSEATRPKSRVFRPSGLIVFALFVLGAALVWWLFADRLVQRGVEATGESLVGARVELESVDLRPTEGSIRMTRLQVANPNAPMTNLLEAGEIVVDLRLGPLLEKKVVVENLVMTGVRFNTPRETSGALENPDPESGALLRQVDAWASQIQLPELSMESLTGVVRTEAISADSLRSVQYARSVVGRVDSMRTSWEAQVTALDPRPRIDSVRAVVQRLETFRPTPLNALQIPALVRDARASLGGVTSLQSEVAALDDAVRAGLGSLDFSAEQLASLRTEDLAYARGLLNIPSLEAPTLSPALFGGTALTWLKPVLYWAQTAERFLPPGLDPRNRPGPQRARAEGTTVEFPGRATWPAFLLQQGELGVEIAGTGAAAGAYAATIRNLTSSPSLLGAPLEIHVGREQGVQGPQGLSLSAVLDHTTDLLRDSVGLSLTGVGLPAIDLSAIGGTLNLGDGESTFSFRRVGEQIEAQLFWNSTDIGWTRSGGAGAPATPPTPGTAEWARELVWSTLTGVERVELAMGVQGDLSNPTLTVASNLGDALATSLRRELGQQIADAEARLRSEVDARIQPLVQDARARVDGVRTQVADRVAAQRQEIDDLRARLEARVNELGSLRPF
ncbi:MAG: TIGR03545 family protein [Longimicrobiales bacterium]